MSDRSLALNPDESLNEYIVRARKALDEIQSRVGTSRFTEEILPELLGLDFSRTRKGNDNKRTTVSDLVSSLRTVLKEKSIVDAEEELDGLHGRFETATFIEVMHEATEDDVGDIVIYATGKFEDGYFKGQKRNFWKVPFHDNTNRQTCKLKDLDKCHICVGGGFPIQSLQSQGKGRLYENKRNGMIECYIRFGGHFTRSIVFSIHGWPREEWLPVVQRPSNDGNDNFLPHPLVEDMIQYLKDTVAKNHPGATARFERVSFETSAIQGPLKRVVFIKRKHQGYLSEFSDTFLHGIPNGISTFVTEILLEKVVPAVGYNDVLFPADALKNIFSFVPRFSKEEYNVLFYGQPIIGGKEEFFNGLEDTLIRDANIRFNELGLASNEFSLKMNTNFGPITFNIFDCQRLGPDVRAGADCAILMFDAASAASFGNIPAWHHQLTQACGNIPIVACGNTVSDEQEAVMKIFGTVYENMKYVKIDIRTESEKPFLLLANWLNGFLAHPKINFLRTSLPNSEEEVAAVRQP